MNPTPDQSRQYFEVRLPGQRLPQLRNNAVRCPFHDDGTASLSVNLEKGVWKCHAGCGEGGLIAFETKFSQCDAETARANISDLLNTPLFSTSQKPEAVYQYRDSLGRLLFEKLRFPGKRFQQRKPNERGGYEYKLRDTKKPLYNLPEVLTSLEICICEGEKDCDNLTRVFRESGSQGVAATTNFDGAGKWRDEYAVYFAGKKVVIFPDNDDIGHKHAQTVARSVYPYAQGVKIVELQNLPEKGDVSDYLAQHSCADLAAGIKSAPQWHPAKSVSGLLVPAYELIQRTPDAIDWLIEGVIERGANGFFCAVPKGGKSWAAIDMAGSLSMGVPWLGFDVPGPVRTALVSREDNPGLTAWRMKQLFASKNGDPYLFEQNLYVNTREQSDTFLLDEAEQVAEMIEAMKERAIQFAIFDVFNVLHTGDENDNQEMRKVLAKLSDIGTKVGCGIGVVHHYNKADSGSMTQRLRGSSAIAGWAEWLIGISMADEADRIRRMEFELKAAQPPDPVHFLIDTNESEAVCLRRCEYHSRNTAPGERANKYRQ